MVKGSGFVTALNDSTISPLYHMKCQVVPSGVPGGFSGGTLPYPDWPIAYELKACKTEKG